jgi:pantothenate kinase
MGESFIESIMLKLTKYNNLNQAFKDCILDGDNMNCDMTVKDIYGDGCVKLNIPPDIIASSFGKCSKDKVTKD